MRTLHNKSKTHVSYFQKHSRSLYRLRLKFEETTRVVCTNYSWSLQKGLRTYNFEYAHLHKWVRRTHWNKYTYLRKCLHV